MKKYNWSQWSHHVSMEGRDYICGYCGGSVGSAQGYFSNEHSANLRIYICTNCGHPTFFDGFEGTQNPSPMIGKDVAKLPPDISVIYNEIRDSIKNTNHTSAVLLARKLIMHLAVKVGGEEGDTFANYIEYLKTSGYIPPKSDTWLKKIKDSGNEKNHQLKLATVEEATAHQKFIELLLSFMFEYSDDESEAEEVK